MKREKRLTKKEQKALGIRSTQVETGGGGHHHHEHIHCTACGKHLDIEQFESQPPSATWLKCDHGSDFASCVDCAPKTKALLEEHDKSGQPVKQAHAWH
jgi:plasmid rolling circle replication initiator protein Rep